MVVGIASRMSEKAIKMETLTEGHRRRKVGNST